MRGRYWIFAVFAGLCACGGGGGGMTAAPGPVVTATPTAAPSSWPNSAQMVLTFRLHRPSISRGPHPHYISGSAQSIQTTVNSVNGGPPPAWASPNPSIANLTFTGASPTCTASGGTATCTITVPAPPGSVSYTFRVYDGLNATGNLLSQLTQTYTIAQGTSNPPITAVLKGVIAWVSINDQTGVSLTASSGSPATPAPAVQINVTAYDADDNTIVDGLGPQNYDNPIALSVSDTSNAVTLVDSATTPSCPGTSSVNVNSPDDKVWVCYTGRATGNVTFSAQEASGGPSGETYTSCSSGICTGSASASLNPVTFSGAQVATCSTSVGCAVSDANFNQTTLFFAATGVAETLSASELGWTQSPFNGKLVLTLNTSPPNSCGSGAGAIVTAGTANPSTSWTIDSQNAGICTGTITDTSTLQSGTVWFSVTTTSFTGG